MNRKKRYPLSKRSRRREILTNLLLAIGMSLASVVPGARINEIRTAVTSTMGHIRGGIRHLWEWETQPGHLTDLGSPEAEAMSITDPEIAFEYANDHWKSAWIAITQGNNRGAIQQLERSLAWYIIAWQLTPEGETSDGSDSSHFQVSHEAKTTILKSIRKLACKIVKMNIQQSLKKGDYQTLSNWLSERIVIGSWWRDKKTPRWVGVLQSVSTSANITVPVNNHWIAVRLVDRKDIMDKQGKYGIQQDFITKLRTRLGYEQRAFEEEREAGLSLSEMEIFELAAHECADEDF